MSGPYHRYVFDAEGRRFVGAFEEMYRAEAREGFDSWQQDDTSHLAKRVSLALLDGRAFPRVLDVGCGKGAFTHLLKTPDNHVLGIDLSETAIDIARSRFPDIEFRALDLRAAPLDRAIGGQVDLVVCLETLSYLEDWRDTLELFARTGRYALVGLYVPEQPIGFVKSVDDLAAAFAAHFTVIEDVRLTTRRQILLFGERIAG
jgi:SAM-dependent methyltransferase